MSPFVPKRTIGTVVEPSLEWFAPIKDDFSIDRKFLKLPILYLGKIRANKPGRSDKFVGGCKKLVTAPMRPTRTMDLPEGGDGSAVMRKKGNDRPQGLG